MEDFAHTSPGSLAGRFLRQFWQPLWVSKDLPAGRAIPVRVMGEDFTLYRGEAGGSYVVGFRCAHRGTQLSTGWVEGECIRCFYHGWKYDGSGQCIEQPAEEDGFARKVRIGSYPVREQLGFIYAFLGQGEPPPLPHYPEFEHGVVIDPVMRTLPFNFYQGLENSVDTVHVSFVHRASSFYTAEAEAGYRGFPGIAVPELYEETEYGLVFQDVLEDGTKRLAYFEMPNVIHIKVWPVDAESGWRDLVGWKVPIDDTSFRNFTLTIAHVEGEAAERYKAHPLNPRNMQRRGDIHELGEDILAGKLALRIEDIGEQEIGIVIGKEGRNLSFEEAKAAIADYTIVIDCSDRGAQMRDTLGPAKSKDWCTVVVGPCLVTADEVDEANMKVRVIVDGEVWFEGNSSAPRGFLAHHLVAYASDNETLYPGDLLGTGTVGAGCSLDIHKWPRAGQTVRVEFEGLGYLEHTIVPGEHVVDYVGSGMDGLLKPPAPRMG